MVASRSTTSRNDAELAEILRLRETDPEGLRRLMDAILWPQGFYQDTEDMAAKTLKEICAIDDARNGSRRGSRSDKSDTTPAQIRAWAAKALMDCVEQNSPPPASLAALIGYLLTGAEGSDIQKKYNEAFGYGPLSPQLRAAMEFEIENPGASAREVARHVGVDHKTIGAWRQDEVYNNVIQDPKGFRGKSGE